MKTSALIMMILTMGTVMTFTGYFFYKVLKTPPKDDTGE
jgi:hypothetical protein